MSSDYAHLRGPSGGGQVQDARWKETALEGATLAFGKPPIPPKPRFKPSTVTIATESVPPFENSNKVSDCGLYQTYTNSSTSPAHVHEGRTDNPNFPDLAEFRSLPSTSISGNNKTACPHRPEPSGGVPADPERQGGVRPLSSSRLIRSEFSCGKTNLDETLGHRKQEQIRQQVSARLRAIQQRSQESLESDDGPLERPSNFRKPIVQRRHSVLKSNSNESVKATGDFSLHRCSDRSSDLKELSNFAQEIPQVDKRKPPAKIAHLRRGLYDESSSSSTRQNDDLGERADHTLRDSGARISNLTLYPTKQVSQTSPHQSPHQSPSPSAEDHFQADSSLPRSEQSVVSLGSTEARQGLQATEKRSLGKIEAGYGAQDRISKPSSSDKVFDSHVLRHSLPERNFLGTNPSRLVGNQISGDSLANAIVAGHLASSRATSPSHLPGPWLQRRSSFEHNHGHHIQILKSRTPSPSRSVLRMQTLRGNSSSSSSSSNAPFRKHKRKRRIGKKHPNKHHEGDRRRWRDAVTERERKRYEGVWAANKGLYVPFFKGEDLVCNIVARDIWRRSRLPDAVLEEAWDLVDSNKSGTLMREEFVVGLWLIDQKLKGRKFPTKVSDYVWNSVRHPSGLKLPVRKLN